MLDDPAVGDHPTLGGGYQWSMGYTGGGTVTNNIGALDLFANGASTIYYDDISISPLLPRLKGDAEMLSETSGGTIDFVLNSGFQHAGQNYAIFMGSTGIEPGTPLPGGTDTLPLNWDLVTNLAIGLINSPALVDFFGQLDNIGVATAAFNTGPLPGALGLNLYFAYTVMNPFNFASNPWVVRITP